MTINLIEQIDRSEQIKNLKKVFDFKDGFFMKYQNPVLRGMYPDPSMCAGPNGKYYMVCSSFQYFPGVPLFESDDIINWRQIGHCLTRKSQLLLEKNNTGSGIYAPTIRYNNGRFYMVVTNVENIGNFYVYTDDIYGEWSEPIKVEQSGIDPSLFFDDDGKVYFISNGNDQQGRAFIQMSQIDITTGKKITENEPLWYGTGGRYIEAPHLYKTGGYYYLLNAEGGTEYGHMVNYARSKNIKGPYEPFPQNPVLTNRNMGGYQLQGAGHGDILQTSDGSWWFCHLAFRQIDKYMPFHHLGRETCIEPVTWKDGWFYIGTEYDKPENTFYGEKTANGYNQKMGFGQALMEVEIPQSHQFKKQNFSYKKTFETTDIKLDWCFLCNPQIENYSLSQKEFILTSGKHTIDTLEKSPTFIGIRQSEFNEQTEVDCQLIESTEHSQAGLTVYMDPKHHYDIFLEKKSNKTFVTAKITIGPVSQIVASQEIPQDIAKLIVTSNSYNYNFNVEYKDKEENIQQIFLASADTRYLSSEVACGFCGVFKGLFAQNQAKAKFTNFKSENL